MAKVTNTKRNALALNDVTGTVAATVPVTVTGVTVDATPSDVAETGVLPKLTGNYKTNNKGTMQGVKYVCPNGAMVGANALLWAQNAVQGKTLVEAVSALASALKLNPHGAGKPTPTKSHNGVSDAMLVLLAKYADFNTCLMHCASLGAKGGDFAPSTSVAQAYLTSGLPIANTMDALHVINAVCWAYGWAYQRQVMAHKVPYTPQVVA